MAGISGWMMMREQRRQLMKMLEQHNDPSATPLRVFNDTEVTSEDRQQPKEFFCEPGLPRLRLAASPAENDVASEHDSWRDEDPDECVFDAPFRILS